MRLRLRLKAALERLLEDTGSARIRVRDRVRARAKGRERGEGAAIEGGDDLKREIQGRGEVGD